MEKILKILAPVLFFLPGIEFSLRNLDLNREGLDDKGADILKQFLDVIGAVQANQPPSTVAVGLAQITAFCSAALTALATIRDSALSKPEKLAAAQVVVDSLSDPTKVYQAVRGNDAAVLASTKVEAKTILRQIIDTPEVETPAPDEKPLKRSSESGSKRTPDAPPTT